jgi:hypothetical protein
VTLQISHKITLYDARTQAGTHQLRDLGHVYIQLRPNLVPHNPIQDPTLVDNYSSLTGCFKTQPIAALVYESYLVQLM